MYTLSYIINGETETMDIQPTKERTVMDNVNSILGERGDPDTCFTLKDARGFTVMTEEDLV